MILRADVYREGKLFTTRSAHNKVTLEGLAHLAKMVVFKTEVTTPFGSAKQMTRAGLFEAGSVEHGDTGVSHSFTPFAGGTVCRAFAPKGSRDFIWGPYPGVISIDGISYFAEEALPAIVITGDGTVTGAFVSSATDSSLLAFAVLWGGAVFDTPIDVLIGDFVALTYSLAVQPT